MSLFQRFVGLQCPRPPRCFWNRPTLSPFLRLCTFSFPCLEIIPPVFGMAPTSHSSGPNVVSSRRPAMLNLPEAPSCSSLPLFYVFSYVLIIIDDYLGFEQFWRGFVILGAFALEWSFLSPATIPVFPLLLYLQFLALGGDSICICRGINTWSRNCLVEWLSET